MNAPLNPQRTISKWDMRRLYNEGHLKELIEQGRFDVKVKTYVPKVITGRIPKGSKSCGTYYYNRVDGKQVAYFHHYETPEGKIIGKPDPKFLLILGIEYHLPQKGQPQPSRLSNGQINNILNKKGRDATITYLYYFAEQAQKIWKEQVTDRLEKWGLKESRS
jgi:hypothetical protein